MKMILYQNEDHRYHGWAAELLTLSGTSRNFHTNDRQSKHTVTSRTTPVESGASKQLVRPSPGGKPSCSSRKSHHPVRPAYACADLVEQAGALDDAAPILGAGLTHTVSPLELFYHSFVAPYDTRLQKPTYAENDGAADQVVKVDEGKETLHFGKELCAKKSSKDNTIGSIDSLKSEEASTGERKRHGDGGLVASQREDIGAKERQFLAETVKRAGLKKDDAHLKVLETKRGAQQQKQPLKPDQSCSIENSTAVLIGGLRGEEVQIETGLSCISLTDGVMVVEDNSGYDSNRGTSGSAHCIWEHTIEDGKASLTPLPQGTGESPPSNTLTVSVSVEDVGDTDITLPPDEAEVSGTQNLSAQIDNAMISMKRTGDRINVSGKYSQVVVTHGRDRGTNKRTKDHYTESSSSAALSETNATRQQEKLYDLTARTGQSTSFNICGENIFITVGSKNTKIKGRRPKKAPKTISANIHGGAGSSGMKAKAGGSSHKKRKNLKKKAKKEMKSFKNEIVGKEKTLESPDTNGIADKCCCSIATDAKIADTSCITESNDNDQTDTISGDAHILPNGKDTPTDFQNFKQEYPCDKNSDFTNEGHCSVRSPDIAIPKLHENKSLVREKSELTSFERSKVIDTSSCGKCINGDERAANNENSILMESTEHFQNRVSYDLEENEEGWIVVTECALTQCLESEAQNAMDTLSNVALVESNFGPSAFSDHGPSSKFAGDAAGLGGLVHSGSGVPEEGGSVHGTSDTAGDDLSVHNRGNIPDMGGSLHSTDDIPGVGGSVHNASDAPKESSSIHNAGDAPAEDGSIHNTADALGGDDFVQTKDDIELEVTVEDSGFLDVFALKRAWRTENRTLKKQIAKYRGRSHQVVQLQKLISQLERETAEMKRLLEGMDRQTAALRNEAADMRCTLSAVCDVSVNDLSRSTEARSLEPVCFRRYTNIRTALDAANLLSAIRSRLKALGELEILTYRKQLVLHHVLPGTSQDRLPSATKRIIRAVHKGPKCKKAEELAAKKGSIVIEVVSPTLESGVVTPSWSDEATNTESPVTTSGPFSESVEGETTPPVLTAMNALNI
ncbi:hypothetical protein ElyMa_000290300 [Elysia marginata]|uniref:BZIP domain-containing protein n=1 Tax=Elysia marginata TaxID=1093978 RepID=A0AAV4F6R7_9GAST|nr:hypothetical protein ElyMa_000290300 [Elysia marginata]